MEITRHPEYVEINFPELLDPDPRLDNITRVFTAIQPGSHNLLINPSEYRGLCGEVSKSRIIYSSRAIISALESMSDVMELIAIYVRSKQVADASPYVQQLEQAGFKTRLFTDRAKAVGWLGTRD